LQICNKQKRRIEGEKRENGGRIRESTNKKRTNEIIQSHTDCNRRKDRTDNSSLGEYSI